MLVESVAIVMILLFMAFIFLRSRRRDYAAATIPLILVPLVHAVVCLLGEGFPKFAQNEIFRSTADVLALAAAVAVMGMICTKLKSRKTKYSYLVLCGGFSTLLTLIFLYEIYNGVL